MRWHWLLFRDSFVLMVKKPICAVPSNDKHRDHRKLILVFKGLNVKFKGGILLLFYKADR